MTNSPQKIDLDDPAIISVLDDVPLWSAPFGLKLLDTVKLTPSINVLDIGTGLGFPLLAIAQRLGSTCHAYGVDSWEGAIQRLKDKIDTMGITNVTPVQSEAEQLQFEDNFFKLIVSNNGINNVKNPEKVLAECYRVADSGAQMVITVNLEDTMKEFYDLYEVVLKENGKIEEIKKMKEHIYKLRKPLEVMIKMISDSGFKLVNIARDSFDLRYLNGTSMFNHFLIKLAFMEPWKSILQENDIPKIFNSLEQKLNEHAEEKGEIKLTIPFVCIDCVKP